MTSKESELYQGSELVSTATKGKARGAAKLGQKGVGKTMERSFRAPVVKIDSRTCEIQRKGKS